MTSCRIQDDLYEAVNGEWLKNAVIPSDRPVTGGPAQLAEEVERQMMADFAAFAIGEKTSDVNGMEDAIRLYRKIIDKEGRDSDGIQPIMPLLGEIKSIQTVDELNKKAKEMMLKGMDLPFSCGVTGDMQDASKHCFAVVGPDIILPDTSYYADENPAGKQLLGVYADMVKKLLAYTDLTVQEQEAYLNDTLAYDTMISKTVKSQVEWADYVKCYNPAAAEEVAAQLRPFDFKGLLASIYGENAPETVIVFDPRAIKELGTYFTEEHFPMYIHWAYVKALLSKTSLLSTEIAAIGTTFKRALMGIAADPVLEKQAYQVVSNVFSEPIGIYYGREYFGEEAKKDIVALVKRIIETWKDRVSKNTFLEESTKQKAILKLSTMNIKMGYPDEVREIYSKFTVSEEDSYFAAMRKISVLKAEEEFAKLLKPVDRTLWQMPGNMVNACYDPSRNDITFPAAILQKPFYSIHQSLSENLGGIGAVVSHEISHAFDNNGAHFDENGNLNNWWTEKDFENFKALTQKMVEQWDGIPFANGKVNGELVVSENIADNGGLAVSLQIMHTLQDADFKAYFINWAKVWCIKGTEAYTNFLLVNDVHAPAKLRANVAIRNFKEWYDTFDVKETDTMFIPEDKRLIMW